MTLSTSWKPIFNKFLSLIEDRELHSLLTDEDMTELLESFLNGSVSLYFKNCRKNLKDKISPKFFRQSFVGNGVQTEFTISEYPTIYNVDSFTTYCTVNDAIPTYTFDETTRKFTITPTPTLSKTVICGYDFVGQFNDNLDDEEQWILSHGMIIMWNAPKLYNAEKLKERLSTKDWNSPHSPANLLDKLLVLRNQSIKEISRLTIAYSFGDDFKGFN